MGNEPPIGEEQDLVWKGKLEVKTAKLLVSVSAGEQFLFHGPVLFPFSVPFLPERTSTMVLKIKMKTKQRKIFLKLRMKKK